MRCNGRPNSTPAPTAAPNPASPSGRSKFHRERQSNSFHAGGIALEFPVHPIQETGKRPTASLDRNLAYLGLVEVLFGYPLDGVVLMTGCDKTTPACIMAAATVNIPAIALTAYARADDRQRALLAGFQMHVSKPVEPRELIAGIASLLNLRA